MRIRKNARLVLGEGASSSTSLIVCQLNRSPWDVVDSFSLQEGWDDGSARNGSLADSIPASDSLRSVESMELSFEYVEKPAPKREREDEIAGLLELEEPITTPFCTRVDGNGWHCHREPKINGCHQPPKKPTPPPPPPPPLSPPLPPPPAAAPKRRGRPKKVVTTATAATTATTTTAANATAASSLGATAATAGNPYEFYYYSGFGPRWSKRRGGKTNIEDFNNKISEAQAQCSSSTSHLMSEDDNNDDDYDDNNNCKSKDHNGIHVIESVVDEELDYIDDDDDDDEGLYGGRRRPRKPIKARSLKSLM